MVLSNAVNHASPEQIHLLADQGVIDTMAKQLECEESSKLITEALECLNHILLHGTKFFDTLRQNPYLNRLEEIGATKKIEKLQEHQSEDVYKAAIQILETFYDVNEPI